MLQRYEILIRFSNAGQYQGASLTQRDDATGAFNGPLPVLDTDWPALAKGINATVLTQVDDAVAAAAEAEKKAADIKAALVAADDSAKLEALRQEHLKDEKQAEIDKLNAQKAEIDARLAELSK